MQRKTAPGTLWVFCCTEFHPRHIRTPTETKEREHEVAVLFNATKFDSLRDINSPFAIHQQALQGCIVDPSLRFLKLTDAITKVKM
jgi:hypothetical protein